MSEANDFLMLDSGNFFGQYRMNGKVLLEDFTVIDGYRLPEIDISHFKCLVINAFIDQEFLYQHKNVIERFLEQKKVLVFSGNLFRKWLPGGSVFVPKTINSHRDYEVTIHQPHPIFDGVNTDDMTYNKGVTGFFARGHHPLPAGAEVLLTLPGREPVTYIDRHSTKGTIVVHAGNDLFGYTGAEKSTGRISGQLKKWVLAEYQLLQEGTSVK